MRKYKKNYTEAFREEQLRWFEERMDKLPKTLQIDEATYTPDLPLTVHNLSLTLRNYAPSIIFSGYMETLMKIKDKLKAEGMK
ncbi:MAG: hypothetical protein J6Y04_07130 [Bacteroidaceae bacterium]|nr:hypothetical protein [Bacteroidaceae bacterium]